MGGAIFNQGGTVHIANSTITGNAAIGGASGKAQAGAGFGGGVFNLNGVLTLTNVTFAGNTVEAGFLANGGTPNTADGGAVYNLAMNVGTATPTQADLVAVANSILANKTGGSDVVKPQVNGTADVNEHGQNLD